MTRYGRGRKVGAIHYHDVAPKRSTLHANTLCGQVTCSSVQTPQVVTCKTCLKMLANRKAKA